MEFVTYSFRSISDKHEMMIELYRQSAPTLTVGRVVERTDRITFGEREEIERSDRLDWLLLERVADQWEVHVLAFVRPGSDENGSARMSMTDSMVMLDSLFAPSDVDWQACVLQYLL